MPSVRGPCRGPQRLHPRCGRGGELHGLPPAARSASPSEPEITVPQVPGQRMLKIGERSGGGGNGVGAGGAPAGRGERVRALGRAGTFPNAIARRPALPTGLSLRSSEAAPPPERATHANPAPAGVGGPGAPDPEDELFRFGISGTNASETPSQESVAPDGFAAREAAPGRAFLEAGRPPRSRPLRPRRPRARGPSLAASRSHGPSASAGAGNLGSGPNVAPAVGVTLVSPPTA